jgi:hypothetical protein
VVLATREAITYQTAATAAAAIHMHYEGEVVETPLGQFAGVGALSGVAVLAPGQGLVEFFPSGHQPLSSLGPVAASAVASGWRVAVIVSSDRMGDGADGDRICFGGPEVP